MNPIVGLAGHLFARVSRSRRAFEFAGKSFPYFIHHFNWTWSNERSVEIPLALEPLGAHTGRRVLEVGNVLSHYVKVDHDILDKYERAPHVLNVDAVDFRADRPYDLILSISTLEHVGWDEPVREPEKPFRAWENLCGLLAPGGLLFATAPLGYNPEFDRLLAERRFVGAAVRYLRRVSKSNEWREAAFAEVAGSRYNSPFPAANALAVLEYRHPTCSTDLSTGP